MSLTILKVTFSFILIQQCTSVLALQNRSHHLRRRTSENVVFKKLPSYRSFQPISIKYHKTVYPKLDDRVDYDITSYDTEYGGVVSNFTSSIYDDNPPIYPNPEVISRSNQVAPKTTETRIMDMPEIEIPDDSLADADLKEHNIIDSVTYLYGFNNCHGTRNEWIILIFVASGVSVAFLSAAVVWLMWSERAKQFRDTSKLYPLVINLCCGLQACTLIYIQAVMGVSSPSQCEKIALLLHYTHLSCSVWIVLIAATVTDFSTSGSVIPLKYNYLIAYGMPAVVVMFNYALSMEQYEIKHYCWMSIEKGMVMGFMVPAMILILINTGIVIFGLQSVNKMQAEHLTIKIQELVDHHIANWPKIEEEKASVDTIDMFTPSSSRKNTDSSDTLEKECFSEEECHYANMVNEHHLDCGQEINQNNRQSKDNGLSLMYLDNISWKSTVNVETQNLKSYLNLCLVLEPFFAVNWVMGVVAVENAMYWPTPTLYLILLLAMYIYLTGTLCTTLPIIRPEKSLEECCEEVVAEPALPRTRTTDSIPLLDPTIQQPIITPAPADSISTISI